MSDGRPPNTCAGGGRGANAVRIAAFAAGAAALWAQVIAVRGGLVAFGGNELVLALFFAWWLFAVGLGALAGGAALRRASAEELLCATLLLFAGVVFWEYAAARGLRGLIGLPAGECPRFGQAAAGLALITVPVSGLVGFLFPLLAAARRAGGAGTGEIYGIEAAGSLAAACLGTYWFLAQGREDLLAFGAVAGLLLAAAVFARRRAAAACAGLLLLWGCIGGFNLGVLGEWGDRLRWSGLMGPFLLERSADTPYGNIAVLKRADQRQVYFDGQLAFAFPDPFADETEVHIAASQAPRVERIVLVGGSPGMVGELLKYGPSELHLAPFDPALPGVLAPFLNAGEKAALAAPAVRMHSDDPRGLFRALPARSIDLILLAAPEPSSAALNRFYTGEFFEEIERVRAAEGVLALGIEAGIHLEEDTAAYAAACLATLRAVFPEVVVAAGGRLRFFASSAPGAPTRDPDLLARRFRNRGIATKYFRDAFFAAGDAFRPEMLARTDARLARGLAAAAPERDTRPTLFLRRLIVAARQAGSALAELFNAVLGLAPAHVAPWALIPGLAMLCLRRRPAAPVLVAVGGTGAWGMALALVLLLAFQVVSGSVYHKIGMLTGAFMCGVSAGALWGRRVRRGRRVLLLAEAAACAAALATPVVIYTAAELMRAPAMRLAAAAEIVLYVWNGILGAITGLEFSAANLCLRGEDSRRGRAAALTDGADHLGACAGALVTGLVLLPSLGLTGAALCCALLKAGTLGGLAAARPGGGKSPPPA
ncbi:MAG TPA: hypothetical protein PKX48_04350 [Planctomycetota bacterium]|jgi:spermidine synthase|nr:hypothetical protein [Planctomycetota bacterium]OQC21460.1 MAG: spermidine synthase [Planctomycetes bacterium ADurb.Bin069]HNR97781.1 hypothetical protein [Planctomycetota bacterium]HNU24752.1 hypothetical protein [Planctomycetota bacterium]HOE29954.1 hypothetical protein [Planctomycetota bacterium]